MNKVRITFEFEAMPDGADDDLISDAIGDLAYIVEGMHNHTKLDLEVETAGLNGPDRSNANSRQASVLVEVTR